MGIMATLTLIHQFINSCKTTVAASPPLPSPLFSLSSPSPTILINPLPNPLLFDNVNNNTFDTNADDDNCVDELNILRKDNYQQCHRSTEENKILHIISGSSTGFNDNIYSNGSNLPQKPPDPASSKTTSSTLHVTPLASQIPAIPQNFGSTCPTKGAPIIQFQLREDHIWIGQLTDKRGCDAPPNSLTSKNWKLVEWFICSKARRTRYQLDPFWAMMAQVGVGLIRLAFL